MPISVFVVTLCVICVVALVISRRGLTAPATVAAPRLLDGLQGSGGSLGNYSVVLTDAGPRKILLIKALRYLTGAGLREAKAFADSPGSAIQHVSRDVGERIVAALQAAGATAELRAPDA